MLVLALFDSMYAECGRPSIPPEKLLRAQLMIDSSRWTCYCGRTNNPDAIHAGKGLSNIHQSGSHMVSLSRPREKMRNSHLAIPDFKQKGYPPCQFA